MTKQISSLLLIAAAALSSQSATALNWQLDDFQCEGAEPFNELDIAVLCDGTNVCTYGDTATITGTVTAIEAFSNKKLTMKPCAISYCPEAYTHEAGKLCDWLVPVDDDLTCGDAGEYTINEELTIPNEEDLHSGVTMLSNLVKVKVEIGKEDECEGETGSTESTYVNTYKNESIKFTSTKAGNDNAGGESTSPVGAGGILLTLFALVSAASLFAKFRRKRQQRAADLEMQLMDGEKC